MQSTVKEANALPAGIPPSKKEIPNEVNKIQRISVKGMLRFTWERQIMINPIVVTKAEPPREKIVNKGATEPLILRRIPRLSFPCRMLICNVRFASPLKNAVKTEAIDAYRILYG